MSGYQDLEKDIDIDVAGLFSRVWKKKLLITLIAIIAGASIFFVMSGIKPRYQTTAQILIEPTESIFTKTDGQSAETVNRQFDQAAVESQVQVIRSDQVALATIKKLKLIDEKEFRGKVQPSLFGNLLMMVGLKKDPLVSSPEERLLKTFRQRLQVYSIEESRVIEIVFWANDRELAKAVTNKIAEEYIAQQKQSKQQTDTNATDFLQPEIEALRKKVQTAEAKVAEFRSNSDILLGNNNALLATQQLSEVSTEISRIRAQRSAAKAKVESIRATITSGASVDVVPEVAASQLIQRLRERQVNLRAQISELSTTLLPSHPRLKALKSQLADFESQIRREARSILVGLENNVDLAAKQEASLTEELNRLKAESARAGEMEVKLRALERDAVSERELLQAYTKRFREAAGRQNSDYQPVNARIISSAQLPTDSFFPQTVPFTIVGAILAAVLTMLAILAHALLSGSAIKTVQPVRRNETVHADEFEMEQLSQPEPRRQPEQMREAVDVPVQPTVADHVGAQPSTKRIANATSRVVAPPMAPAMDSEMDPAQFDDFDENGFSSQMAVAGLISMDSARIAVVSPDETGSQISVAVARQLAGAGKMIALIDLSGNAAASAAMQGTTNNSGIRDVMAGTADLENVLFNDKGSTAAIVPVGSGDITNIEDALARLNLVIEALENAYDYVMIDCGMSDLDGVANVADSETVVLVCGANASVALTFERQLIDAGYVEAITVNPSVEEQRAFVSTAA